MLSRSSGRGARRSRNALTMLVLLSAPLLAPACIVASEETARGTVVRVATATPAPAVAVGLTSVPPVSLSPTAAALGATAAPTVGSTTTSIPPAAPAPSPGVTTAPAGAQTTAYTVQQGDTLFALSRRAGVSVAELARINGIAPDSIIRVGQQLQLPSAGSSGGPSIRVT